MQDSCWICFSSGFWVFEAARGFSKIVAIKRLHAEVAKDPDGAAAFMDEARLTSRIRHPNVVPIVDVVQASIIGVVAVRLTLGRWLARRLGERS